MNAVRGAARLILVALVLAGCAGGAQAVRPDDREGIKALVAREAVHFGIPVSLALAVAHAESNFNGRAQSHKGARGVMQIMPRTAEKEYGIRAELLWQPRINVRLGLHFLKRLLTRYRGRIDLALSYYNGGSAVGTLPHARVIPATTACVARVKRLQRHYQLQSGPLQSGPA